jgi:hypothetical protein
VIVDVVFSAWQMAMLLRNVFELFASALSSFEGNGYTFSRVGPLTGIKAGI